MYTRGNVLAHKSNFCISGVDSRPPLRSLIAWRHTLRTGNIRWPAVLFFLYFVPLTPGRILRVRWIYVVTFGRDPSVRFCADDVVAIEQRRVKRQTQNELRVDFHIGWVLPRVALTTCNFYFRQAIIDIDGFC